MSKKIKKKNSISAADSVTHKIKVLSKKKKRIRHKSTALEQKLILKIKQLTVVAKEKETIRHKLAVVAKEKAEIADVLKQSEIRYKALFTGASEGIIVADLQTKQFRFVNPAACKMFGYTKKEFLQLGVMDIHPKKFLDLVLSEFQAQAQGKKIKVSLPCLRKDGTVFNADISAALTIVDGNRCNVGFFSDTTEAERAHKKLENANLAARNVLEDLKVEKKALDEAKAKDEAMLASIGDGVVATDQDRKVILINEAAERMLGWNAKQAMGILLEEVCPISDEKGNLISDTERPISFALKGKATTTTTTTTTIGPAYFYTRKDGSKFPVAIAVAPIRVGHEIIGAIDVFRDITREKEIDKAKTEFISLASHQLRTPPTAMNWYLEMLLNQEVGSLTAKQKKYLKEVYQNNQRMISLVNGLLNISRMEARTLAVEPKLTNLSKLAGEIIKELQLSIKDKQLRVIQNIKNDLSVSFDPRLFQIILENLVSNAVKYTPARGLITIMFDLKHHGERLDSQIIPNDSLVVTVSDTGYGIPKAQQAKIFTKLFRADNIKLKDTDGSGLGLYLVKLIVDYCQGKIWFKSKENQGSTFFIILPVEGVQKNRGTKHLISSHE